MKLRYGIYLMSSMSLCACTVGPDFIAPEEPHVSSYVWNKTPTQFGDQHINKNKPVAAAWWHEFRTPALNQVMQLGIQNNYSLRAMHKTLQQAKEMVNAVSAQLWPQISLSAAMGRQKYGVALFGPVDITIPPYTYYEIGPNLTYTLDLFGGTRRSIEKQQAMACYQWNEYQAAYLALTGNIFTTALAIASINAQIMALKDIVREDEKNLKLVTQAFNLGSSTQADVLSAKTQLTNDEALLPNLYQQQHSSQDALNLLVGKLPATWQPPHFELENFHLPNQLPFRIPSHVVHARPDILAAEAMLHAASASVGVATANLYPNLTLTAATLQEALTPANLFMGNANAWSYLINMSAPIFNGGMLKAQQHAAQYAFQAAYFNYQQVVLQAFIQVSDVLHALKYDTRTEQLQKKALHTAKDSLKLARLSYAAGGVGILAVLDAERQYSQARLGYVKAKSQRYQDVVQFYLVLGGGQALPFWAQ